MLNLRNGKKIEFTDETVVLLPSGTLVSDLYAKDIEYGKIFWENYGQGSAYTLKDAFRGNGNQNIIPNTTIPSIVTHFDLVPTSVGGGGLTAPQLALLNGAIQGTEKDIDPTLLANSDAKIATQKATKAYIDSKVTSKNNSKFIQRTNSTLNVLPTPLEFPTPTNGDITTVTLLNSVQELYSYTAGVWVKTSTITPVVLDGNNAVVSRANNVAGIVPIGVEVPSPINGDTADVYLLDGTREVYAHNGTIWVLLRTIAPSSTDGNDKHITRANTATGVAPTALELPAPVAGDTAKVRLTNDTVEFWSYNGTIWANDFAAKPSKDTTTDVFGFALGTLLSGNHFDTNSEGGTVYISIPSPFTIANLDVANLIINAGSFPNSITTIKIVRKPIGSPTLTDFAVFTVPANATALGGVITTTPNTANLAQSDLFFINASQSAPNVDVSIPHTIKYS
jgi:hypothetical protein